MPTYDYRCNACGHSFEAFHAMSAAPISKCPQCGKKRVERLIGMGAGLIFKGSGFYLTDYARKGEAKTESKSECGAKPDGTCSNGACAKAEAPAATAKA